MDIGLIGARLVGELSHLAPTDLLTVATLAALEGILSVDNALVLAILARQLEEKDRAKALTYGLAGAFVFRFIALVFAAQLMEMTVFKLLGGAYLLYLSMKHLFFYREEAYHQGVRKYSSLWRTILVVELTDLAFSVDSITAAVAMTQKLSIVWLGGILGIICLRFSSRFFMVLLEKLPRLEDLAYQIIFFVGVKLTLEGFRMDIGHETFWLVMGVITVLGSALICKDWSQRRALVHYEDKLLDDIKSGAITPEEVLAKPGLPGKVVAWLYENGLLRLPPPGGAQAP